MGLIIPLYTYPTDATWSMVAIEARLHPTAKLFAIINPNNGVGVTQDPAFTVGVRILQQAGVKCLGYVATAYGSRRLTEISAEALNYVNWYSVDGIFWDEYLSGWQAPPVPGLSIGNPGTQATGNIPLVTYESAGMPPVGTTGNYIAHSVAQLPASYPKPAYYYITDDRATYMVLPTYFSALVAGDAQLPSGQTPPPPAPKRLTLTTPSGVYSWNVD